MTIELGQPDTGELGGIIAALGEWQDDAGPVQLHPGDLGWLWRFGAAATAAATRTWRRGGRLVAVGELDGHGLVRLAIAPDARHDAALSQQLAADLSDPGRGVLPEGVTYRRLDVTSDADWAAARDWVAQEWGGLDVVVLNAFPQDITAWLAGAAQELDARTVHQVLAVEGMDCAACALKIETAMQRLPGVSDINVSYTGGTLALKVDPDRTSQRTIAVSYTHLTLPTSDLV